MAETFLAKYGRCSLCGEPVRYNGRGKPRKYCDDCREKIKPGEFNPKIIDLHMQRAPTFSEEKHYLGSLCIHGHDYQETGQSWRHKGHGNCVECTRERARAWRYENPERASKRDRLHQLQRTAAGEKKTLRVRFPIMSLIGNARGRARKLGLPCDMDVYAFRAQWLAQEGKCFWTGVELKFSTSSVRHPLCPSIDRLESAKGYVKGNVVWTTLFINRARGDISGKEFLNIMRIMGLTVSGQALCHFR